MLGESSLAGGFFRLEPGLFILNLSNRSFLNLIQSINFNICHFSFETFKLILNVINCSFFLVLFLVLTDTAFAFFENKFVVHVKQATP